MEPSYLALAASGELSRRAEAAAEALASCVLCPRQCRVDRTRDRTGQCQTGRLARVASWNLHFGEEAPLVGQTGSGTIFFAGCNLGCLFCQNHDISHRARDFPALAANQLAHVMLRLQKAGAVNINLVTPSHVVPHILAAVDQAAAGGLRLPLVYNTSAYDGLETLGLLEGVVDIYMPDAKFVDPGAAARCCAAPDYPDTARAAMAEMHRQVGDLVLDERGLAVRGLLVRHLVMPGNLAGTDQWMAFLAGLSPRTYVNIMDQYRPCGEARAHPPLDRPASQAEYQAALASAKAHGLTRLDDPTGGGVFRFPRRLAGE